MTIYSTQHVGPSYTDHAGTTDGHRVDSSSSCKPPRNYYTEDALMQQSLNGDPTKGGPWSPPPPRGDTHLLMHESFVDQLMCIHIQAGAAAHEATGPKKVEGGGDDDNKDGDGGGSKWNKRRPEKFAL
ncbi:hypothetical protein BDL97_12G097200 [Sphagnum fallax]|nr:hypothetical protein BDL97_12G097200 [Sphagnum fallax]